MKLTEAEREALVTAIAAAVNWQSFDARAGISDLAMAEEITYVTSAAASASPESWTPPMCPPEGRR